MLSLRIKGEYRTLLKRIYELNILFEQEQNCLRVQPGKITILSSKDYEEADFEHEMAHLSLMTQEAGIKRLWPRNKALQNNHILILSDILRKKRKLIVML